jgi:hypothetical protein
MSSSTVVAMFTHSSRETVRNRTITAFQSADVPVHHVQVQTERPKAALNRRNAWQALKYAMEHVAPKRNATAILLIEDDITPASTLSSWLSYLEQNETRITTLYSPVERFFPERYQPLARGTNRRDPASAIVTVQDLRGWWGSQALWIPLPWAKILKDDSRMQIWEHGLGPWDHAVRKILLERDATMGLCVPLPIQHDGVPNLITPTKRPHSSRAFRPDALAPGVIGE